MFLPYLFAETLKQVSNIPSHFLQEFILVSYIFRAALQPDDGAVGSLQLLLDLVQAPGVGIVPLAQHVQPEGDGDTQERGTQHVTSPDSLWSGKLWGFILLCVSNPEPSPELLYLQCILSL